MTPSVEAAPAVASPRYDGSVHVTVVGGKETNPLWAPEIGDAAFCTAVENAVEKSGVFTGIGGEEAPYRLGVRILHYSQPTMGLDFNIAMESAWTLTDSRGKVLWSDSIKSRYKAKWGDAFIAAERVQKAKEGAARENIRLGVESLNSRWRSKTSMPGKA